MCNIPDLRVYGSYICNWIGVESKMHEKWLFVNLDEPPGRWNTCSRTEVSYFTCFLANVFEIGQQTQDNSD